MGGGPGKDHELAMSALRRDDEPSRWDRGTWIRLGLAVTPIVIIVALGFFIR